MGERMEVEVWNHEAQARWDDNGELHYFNTVPEGSLTAARLRLADAAEALGVAEDAYLASDADESGPEWDAALEAVRVYDAALAALRTARGA